MSSNIFKALFDNDSDSESETNNIENDVDNDGFVQVTSRKGNRENI